MQKIYIFKNAKPLSSHSLKFYVMASHMYYIRKDNGFATFEKCLNGTMLKRQNKWVGLLFFLSNGHALNRLTLFRWQVQGVPKKVL